MNIVIPEHNPELSSPEDSRPTPLELAKPKKKPRACDHCRRKKSRCDGAEMPDHRCTRCIIHEFACTYGPVNTRPPKRSYVQVLESRLQNMERLVSQLHPDARLSQDFSGLLESASPAHSQSPQDSNQPSTSGQSSSFSRGISPPPPDSPPADSDSDLDPSDDEQETWLTVLDLSSRSIPPGRFTTPRYYGKSSHLMFLHSIIDLKQEYSGKDRPRSAGSSMQEYEDSITHYMGLAYVPSGVLPEPDSGRHDPARARTTEKTPYRDFPPPDLMQQLVHAYFTHHETYLPLLHRPTLVKAIQDSVHLREKGFGGVLLLVCALGSRWVDDPRTLAEGAKLPGWHWFKQVESTGWTLMGRPRLEDLQCCLLMMSYLDGSNMRQGTWNVLGLGLRMAQDVGAHRKKMKAGKPTVEDELWKRAFWALVCLDRFSSYALGRPCAIHDEDIDTELLAEVDDEYWINPDPELAFKQPEGQPSRVAFANCLVRLLKILAFASRTIYSTNKQKLRLGYIGPEWEQKMVADLVSAMNKWVDSVPEHLRWDANRTNPVFMNQSATLYANYYFVQICIHRPFIPSSRKASRLPFPSLAICTNAARSCTHVIDIQYQRTGVPLLLNRTPLFSAALVLLLNVWGAKRTGLTNESAVSDVQKCVSMLRQLQAHTSSARSVLEVLNGLMSLNEFSLPDQSQVTSATQPDISSPNSATIIDIDSNAVETLFADPFPSQDSSQVASSSRGDDLFQLPAQSPLYTSTASPLNATLLAREEVGSVHMDPSFTLPVHTHDLGRLPFHHGFHSFDGFTEVTSGFDSHLQQRQHGSLSVPPIAPPIAEDMDINAAVEGFAMPFASYGSPLSALPDMATPSSILDPNSSSLSLHTQGQTQESAMGQQRTQAQAPTHWAQVTGPAPDGNFGFQSIDMEVAMAMMSAENVAFADNMMEMWSTAPASLEMDVWGPYLSNMMTSAASDAVPPPPRPSSTGS